MSRRRTPRVLQGVGRLFVVTPFEEGAYRRKKFGDGLRDRGLEPDVGLSRDTSHFQQ
jgi:hypothetical protein